jgi:hypothetical protein
MLSAKRTRRAAPMASESNQNSGAKATNLSLDPPVVHGIPNVSQEETREVAVAALLEGVPMQSRRRLSISPEADETQQ